MNIITEVAAIHNDNEWLVIFLVLPASIIFCVWFLVSRLRWRERIETSICTALGASILFTFIVLMFSALVYEEYSLDSDVALKAMESCGYEHIEVSSYGWSAYKDNQKVEGNIDLVGETYLVLGEGKCN